jgi:hypothetical protein
MKKWKMGAIALAVTLPLGGVAAFAAQNQSASAESKFEQQYQNLSQKEQSLLQQAEASTVDTPQIDALKQTVNVINQQVSSLYTIEQALAKQASSIPQISPSPISKDDEEIDQAQKEVSKLQAQLKNDQQRMERDKKSHSQKDKSDLHQVTADYNKIKTQLAQAQAQLAKWDKQKDEDEAAYGYWREHPYNGGLTELRQSILSLEQAAIHYTEQWISLEKSSAGNTTGSGNSTGGNSTGGNATTTNNTSGNTTGSGNSTGSNSTEGNASTANNTSGNTTGNSTSAPTNSTVTINVTNG